MKYLLLLLGAVAMAATFSSAEGKCNGKTNEGMKIENKCASGMDKNKTKMPPVEEKEGKCMSGKMTPKMPEKKCQS